jgi:hypothetical protein
MLQLLVGNQELYTSGSIVIMDYAEIPGATLTKLLSSGRWNYLHVKLHIKVAQTQQLCITVNVITVGLNEV